MGGAGGRDCGAGLRAERANVGSKDLTLQWMTIR
jgi:hypothetical protein